MTTHAHVSPISGLPLTPGITNVSTGNGTTGSNSANVATATDNELNNLLVNNSAATANALNGVLTSGGNVASMNTGSGTATTGAVSAGANVVTDHNGSAAVQIGGGMSPIANLTAANHTTGSSSTNVASSTANYVENVAVVNNSQIANNTNLVIDTGHNAADNNTGNGLVSSGPGSFIINYTNVAN